MAAPYSVATSDRASHEKDKVPSKEDVPAGVVQMRVDGRGDEEMLTDVTEEVDGVFGAQGSEPGQVNYRRSVLPLLLSGDPLHRSRVRPVGLITLRILQCRMGVHLYPSHEVANRSRYVCELACRQYSHIRRRG